MHDFFLFKLFHNYDQGKNGLLKTFNNSEGMNTFVRECIKYLWLMKVQDPPMVLHWAETQAPFDKALFKFYTQTGHTVAYNVWPALKLHTNGPLMAKGVVQATK